MRWRTRNTRRCRKRSSAPQRASWLSGGTRKPSQPRFRAGALWLTGSYPCFGGGVNEGFLECALAAGLAGNRQLRGPSGDADDERCGALAARDLDWCTPTDLSEQPGAVLLG